jgi:hypothetical protein
MRGESARRHVLELEGPMRLAFTYEKRHEGLDDVSSFFVGALCASRNGFAGCMNGFQVESYDKAQGTFHRAPDQPQGSYFLDTDYAIELAHDGAQTIEMKRAGEVVANVAVDALTSGGVLFWVRSERTILFDSIVIEGRPTAASLEALRAGWIEARVSELGFGAAR